MNGSDWIPTFIARLRALDPPGKPEAARRAELAHLRRGLGKPAAATLAKLGWLFGGVADRDIDTAVLVAGLFAVHSGPPGQGTLGSALGGYRHKTGAEESTDKRFAHLIDSDREDLPERLRHVVRLLKAKEVPVDWFRLTRDLLDWNSLDRRVQWNWSRDYWRPRDSAATPQSPPETPTHTA